MVKVDLLRFKRGGVREGTAEMAFTIALLWIVALGIVPMVIAMVIGLAQGTIAEDVATPAPGYPAFPVLSPGLIVPASLLMFSFARTFTWPLKRRDGIRRGDIAGLAFTGLGVSTVSTLLDESFLSLWAERLDFFVIVAFLAVGLLSLLRWVAGKLHLVPRSWREEPVKPKRRRPS